MSSATNHYFFGFVWWKKNNIRHFFPEISAKQIIFVSSLEQALQKGLNKEAKVYIWGKKPFDDVERYAKENTILISRIEDGFIRSVSLGSDLTKAYSIVVDSRGIYFDPTQESDLEHILNHHTFDEVVLQRAKKIQTYLIEKKISKYNSDEDKTIVLKGHQPNQEITMVIGQVEDDASIVYGASGMSNLDLLKEARKKSPKSYLIYKPHPDVLAGNRVGDIPSIEALKYANKIVTNTSLDSVLSLCDSVHTMTSLVGFEALIRGKKVYTYGMPFYAGWGLSIDKETEPRRERELSLEALIAGTLLLYPRYIHPKTNKLCEIEALLKQIDKEKRRYNKPLYKVSIDSRNFLSRKAQLVIRKVFGE